jgi:hypothetical protein
MTAEDPQKPPVTQRGHASKPNSVGYKFFLNSNRADWIVQLVLFFSPSTLFIFPTEQNFLLPVCFSLAGLRGRSTCA